METHLGEYQYMILYRFVEDKHYDENADVGVPISLIELKTSNSHRKLFREKISQLRSCKDDHEAGILIFTYLL